MWVTIVSFICLFQFAANCWTWILVSEYMHKLSFLSCFSVFDIAIHYHNFVKHNKY